MPNDRRFVLDTNILVSAIVFRGVAREVFAKAKSGGMILISVATIEELQEVLSRKKFDAYVTPEARTEFLAEFVAIAELVPVTEAITVCRDPKDDKFLELAISGVASYDASGDTDLTALSPFREIPVYTPVQFLSLNWDDSA